MNNSRCNYHHGDLRNALIIAAAELIERDGTLEFSMTEAAAYSGVSAAAPYRHFADKDELLGSVRDLAILGLSNLAAETAERFPIGSLDAILAIGHAYLSFAREKRAFFSLIWEDRGDLIQRRDNPMSKHYGFTVLVDLVRAFFDVNENAEVNEIRLATQVWSMAHGIATLEANQMLDLFDRSIEPESLLDESVRTMLAGVVAQP